MLLIVNPEWIITITNSIVWIAMQCRRMNDFLARQHNILEIIMDGVVVECERQNLFPIGMKYLVSWAISIKIKIEDTLVKFRLSSYSNIETLRNLFIYWSSYSTQKLILWILKSSSIQNIEYFSSARIMSTVYVDVDRFIFSSICNDTMHIIYVYQPSYPYYFSP